MSILNINTNKNNNGRIKVQGKTEALGDVYAYILKQAANDKYKFYGSIHSTKGDNGEAPVNRTVVWNISKFDSLTISIPGATKEIGEEAKKIATEITKGIISRETRLESKFIKLLNESKTKSSNIIDEDDLNNEGVVEEMKNDVKDEVVITKERPNVPKLDVSDAVKSFMKEFGTAKLVETLELAVAKYNDALGDITLLEERLTNANESPEEPDDDPNGGQSIPAFDVAEFKAQLKAEILAELKEELKASSVPAPVKVEEPKQTREIKLPKPIEKETKKEEIIKEEIKPEKKSFNVKTATYEELVALSYKNLQKVGQALKLGSENVANQQQLLAKIAAKLNLKAASAKEEVAIETLNIKKPESKHSSARAEYVDYSEDITDIGEDISIEDDIEKEVSAVDQIKDKTFTDPAKQRLQQVILNRRK